MKRLMRAAIVFVALSVAIALLAPAGSAERARATGPARAAQSSGGTGVGEPDTPEELVARELDAGEEGLSGEPDEGEDILGREEWFYGQRAFPGKAVPKGAYLKSRKQAGKLPRFPLVAGRLGAAGGRLPTAGGSFAWSSIGPRPIHSTAPLDDAGRVTSLAVQTDQTGYAGAAGGGVWKTTNGGLNWTPLFDKQASLAIGSIAIDPNNSNNVWVGTGEGNFSADSY